MKRDQDERYFDAPFPTVTNSKDAQFQQWCTQGTMDSSHFCPKFAQALPRKGHLNHLFQKKRKNGGYFNDVPETCCQRKFYRGKLCVSGNTARS
jgi:hypothetical protein